MDVAMRRSRRLRSCPDDFGVGQCCVTSSLTSSTDAHAATPARHARRKPRATGMSTLASELHERTRASRTHVRSTDQTG
ncbi:hypothetical protein A8D95_21080 [Burkholderia cenocepacia]|uniref:Uncharacterized protein n=1 Tax=Burkholderia cenocepacia TaxID=95486 RepID=A0A1V2WBF1_9BURK|nr:hypothetical protein A8D83_26590 [Burkholderia cenocepacia]ONJ21476.1 hypothetical protein A8D90_21480 [Burkholderia cenocepacia]ONP30325.1 hypothetical protein A8D84_13555 [Burkholderia cenocepacia]ONP42658.1 hypothetical protein A8D85_09275 [Burkholderia cenocepacia]ONP47201.1 hypothetical protein A8D87_19975 [Burkholderia cenocepacia]